MTDLTIYTKVRLIHILRIARCTVKILHSVIEIRVEFDHVVHIMRVFTLHSQWFALFQEKLRVTFHESISSVFFSRVKWIHRSRRDEFFCNRKFVVSRMIDSLTEISMLSRNSIYSLSANSWWLDSLQVLSRLNLDRSILRRFWKRRESTSNSRAHAAADLYEFLK